MKGRVMGFAVAAVLAACTVAAAQPGQGVPAQAGKASFKFGGVDVAYDKVTGEFQQNSGFTMTTLTFSKEGTPGRDHLTISLMVKGPGPVDLNQPFGNGIGYWKGGAIFSYQKGKSQCTMTLTRLTPTAVEGTAECPVVNEVEGSRTDSLTAVKFSASTGK